MLKTAECELNLTELLEQASYDQLGALVYGLQQIQSSLSKALMEELKGCMREQRFEQGKRPSYYNLHLIFSYKDTYCARHDGKTYSQNPMDVLQHFQEVLDIARACSHCPFDLKIGLTETVVQRSTDSASYGIATYATVRQQAMWF